MNKSILLICGIILVISCHRQQKNEQTQYKYTNDLIYETSPYLLQHAHNPVNWHAWNDETLALAKRENKLILISVGYSACHWCHVMEEESFENEAVAEFMNANFINIKIDKEERPDIDQVYMTAVQLITKSGGWPLNCIALPDGRPFWGGTYFPTEQWLSTLTEIANLYMDNPSKIIGYAENLTQGIQQSNLVEFNSEKPKFTKDKIDEAINIWSSSFDNKFGGKNGTPKFPLPNNQYFLLRYAAQTNNSKLKKYVNTTLEKIALGGIFDQVGGGFARYSTDENWHIPHFEKMLYDNAQLVSLYSDAYLIENNELYRETVFQTLEFVERELTASNGGFYSSLDADSIDVNGDLTEGAFYVWTKEELNAIIKSDFPLFSKYYNINEFGLWEDDRFNLIRLNDDVSFSKENDITIFQLKSKVRNWRKALFKERKKKNRPRLDDKILTSWNAMMLKAYVDAYRVFNDEKFIEAALKNATFLKTNLIRKDGGLNRNYKNGKSNINGYLEDYSNLIEAYIALYEFTLDQDWLNLSKGLADYCYKHFYDENTQMFYFTSNEDENLISRRTEIIDDVIPASNSILARNLFKLGHYFENKTYISTSEQMLNNVEKEMIKYGSGYSNWLQLYCDFTSEFYEIAIVGEAAEKLIKEINGFYIPNKIIAASKSKSEEPLLKHRFQKGKTLIYVCLNQVCKFPVSSSNEALVEMKIDIK